MFRFELHARGFDDGKLVVFMLNEFIPGNLTRFLSLGVKDLADTRRPIPILFEVLRHRNGIGPCDVNFIVQHTCGLRVETVQQ